MDIKPELNPAQKYAIEKLQNQFIDSYKNENKQLKAQLKKIQKTQSNTNFIMMGFFAVAMLTGFTSLAQRNENIYLETLLQDPDPTDSTVVDYWPAEPTNTTPHIIWHTRDETTHPADNIKA